MVGHTLGIALAIVGAIVFLTGALNFCLVAPFAGGPLRCAALSQG
jgi:hypothetical protein